MKFEWDQKKAKTNLKKHGISFHEAATVFGDALAVTFDDPDHSINEQRLLTFGLSSTRKRLIVSHPYTKGRINENYQRSTNDKKRETYI